jgi:Fe-Mn family superoxide dismutase
MYEHAFALDYGAKAGAYVDAFMNAFSWRAANQAFRTLAG